MGVFAGSWQQVRPTEMSARAGSGAWRSGRGRRHSFEFVASKKLKMKIIIAIIIFFIYGITGNCQSYKIDDTLLVNSINGLNCRSKPLLNSKIIKKIKYGERVIVDSIFVNSGEIVIDELKGTWLKVKSDDQKCFVFDGYLTKIPVIEQNIVPNNHSIFLTIDNYIERKIGIIDSVKQKDVIDGERTHRVIILNLNDGHKLIKNYYWESYEYELFFKDVRESECVQLLKNMTRLCEIDGVDIENMLKKTDYSQYVFVNESCCYFSLINQEEGFLIKIKGGP